MGFQVWGQPVGRGKNVNANSKITLLKPKLKRCFLTFFFKFCQILFILAVTRICEKLRHFWLGYCFFHFFADRLVDELKTVLLLLCIADAQITEA